MKNICSTAVLFCLCVSFSSAQILLGTTFKGGNDGGGTINKFAPATNSLTVLKSFESLPAYPFYTNLVQGNDGKLYGMTSNGGKYDFGIIFSYDPVTLAYTKHKDFNIGDGTSPEGSLMLSTDGKLYGMTIGGGPLGGGVIFSFDPATSIYLKLMDFDYSKGTAPEGTLVEATDGKLYGTTRSGGLAGANGNAGVMFSFEPSTSTYTKLKDFDYTSTAVPVGSLIQAADSKLYGMTSFGGVNGYGVIYSYDISSSTYANLKDFDVTDGANPTGSLMQARNGRLYAMTSRGGTNDVGVAFSFDILTSTITKLLDFDNVNGAFPSGNFIQGTDGKLYAIAGVVGGSNSYGVIFSIDANSSAYQKLFEISFPNGGAPRGSLIQARNGNLYGMTGGNQRTGVNLTVASGIIFSFNPVTLSYSKLKDFDVNESGTNVSGSLLQGNNGKLYGMTTYGGTGGAGVIFAFDAGTFTFSKIVDFDPTEGANPNGSLIQANDGKLYGITPYGGNSNAGVIFSLDPLTLTYRKLKDFSGLDGVSSYGSLFQATDGNLYGMTNRGGTTDLNGDAYGVFFSFNPLTLTYSILKDFSGPDGARPFGSVMQAMDGKLYGMTVIGGSNNAGTIFSFDLTSATFTKVLDFNPTMGENPSGSLIQAVDGKLYGTTRSGGINGDGGVIFSFDPATFAYVKVKDFDFITGAQAVSLMEASDGKLYGMTEIGTSLGIGFNPYGAIFSVDPLSSAFTLLKDFDYTNGGNPNLGSAFIELSASAPLPVTLLSFSARNRGDINQLSWDVTNEQNLNLYELQRSIDGQNFDAISEINAVGLASYTYNDIIEAGISPIYFYRLKIVDLDGQYKYSDVIKIVINQKSFFAIANPNPIRDIMVITVTSRIKDKAILILTDLSGRELFRREEPLSAGINVLQINGNRKLSKGTYLLTIMTSQNKQSIKLINSN